MRNFTEPGSTTRRRCKRRRLSIRELITKEAKKPACFFLSV
jgi:hypothetical protein